MFNIILAILSMNVVSNEARIADIRCTEFSGPGNDSMFAESALNCENRFSDTNCLMIYGRAVRQGESVDRHVKCYQSPTTRQLDEQLVNMALKTCPKTCGYCCLTKEYNCKNKRNPRVNCAKVTREQCRSELWRPILMEDCPSACGLCAAHNCYDVAPGCAADPGLCKNPRMKTFVKTNCKKTCGYCSSNSGNDDLLGTTAPLRAPQHLPFPNNLIPEGPGVMNTTTEPSLDTQQSASRSAKLPGMLDDVSSTTKATHGVSIRSLPTSVTRSAKRGSVKTVTKKPINASNLLVSPDERHEQHARLIEIPQ